MRRRRRDTLETLWWATVLLVGIPVGLLHLPGRPAVPRHVPTHQQWLQILQQPPTPAAAKAGLVVIGWTVWAILLYAIVRDLLGWAAYLARRLPHLRLPGPLQSLSAAVLGAVAVSSTTAGAAHAAAHSRPAPTSTGPGPLLQLSVDTRPATTDARVTTPPTPHDGLARPMTEATLVDTQQAATAQSAPATLTTVGDQHDTYTVKHGDTLWHIAGTQLRNPLRWPEIYHLNQDHYDQHGRMRHGDHIEPGWVLALPDDPHPTHADPAAPSAPASPSPSPPDPSQSLSASPRPSGTGQRGDLPTNPAAPRAGTAAANPAPTATPSSPWPRSTVPVSPSAPTSGGGSAAAASAAKSSPPAAGAAPKATGDTPPSIKDGHQRPSNDGIEVPGGWLSPGLGAALLFAVAMLWRRRRHRYAPTRITTAILDDSDLAAPLGARTLIRQKLRRSSPTADVDDPTDTGPTVREYVDAERTGVTVVPELPAMGPTGPEIAGLRAASLTGGLGLDGDGARDAARALLVATLSSGHSGDPDARGRVVIPAATLASLIGVTAADLGAMDRLVVTDTFADAVVHVEEEILRRSRTIADAQVANVAALLRANPFAEPLPQLLLIADTPQPVWQGRISTALGLGQRANIAAVFIGPWNTTLNVAADGTTTGGDPDAQRLAVLDAASTDEAIAMLREAHTDNDPGIPDTVPVSDPDPPVQADTSPPQRAAAAATDEREQPADTTPVQVRVLGHPAVLDATGQPAPRLRAKSLELLVYLAVNRNGAKLTDIMEAIWPDATLRRAEQRLSTCAANLRGVIRAVATATHPPAEADDGKARRKLEPIINTGGFYRLDPTIVTVDWWRMLDEYAQIAEAADDQHRLGHLRAALADNHGPLADGTDYDWIDTDRERVRRHQIKLLAHTADLLAEQDPHTSRSLLDDACALDPLSDELARRAMRAAAAVGDADGIRHRLDILRSALEDADLDLAADTEQLAATLLHDLQRDHRDDT